MEVPRGKHQPSLVDRAARLGFEETTPPAARERRGLKQKAPPAARERRGLKQKGLGFEETTPPAARERLGSKQKAVPAARERLGSKQKAPPPARERLGSKQKAPPPARERRGLKQKAPPPARERLGSKQKAPPPARERPGQEEKRLPAGRQLVYQENDGLCSKEKARMSVSMKRILAAVYPPENTAALVILAMAIVDKMDGNPYFPNPIPTLAKGTAANRRAPASGSGVSIADARHRGSPQRGAPQARARAPSWSAATEPPGVSPRGLASDPSLHEEHLLILRKRPKIVG